MPKPLKGRQLANLSVKNTHVDAKINDVQDDVDSLQTKGEARLNELEEN